MRLHVKITLSVSLIVVIVLIILFSFYWSAARGLVQEENRRDVELMVAQLGQHLSSERVVEDLAALRNDALFYKTVHREVDEVHIYGFTPTGVREVVTIPLGARKVLPIEFLQPVQQGKLFSRIERVSQGKYIIQAAAPIESVGQPIGIVMIRAQTASYHSLLTRLNRITLVIALLAIVTLTGSLDLLFRQLINRPVKEILAVMHRAEQGNLDATVPVRSADEMGRLCSGLNTMLAQIRRMQQELTDEQKRLEILVAEATSELSQRNRELQEANRELFALQRQLVHTERLAATGHMAAQIAHEVGTPLNLVSGHIQVLKSRMSDDDANRRFDIILQQIARIERIVRQFLDSTRQLKAEMVPVHIGPLLQQVVEMAAPTLESRKIEVTTRFDSKVPVIRGSPERLQQVFINLIDNSLDAMPSGGQLVILIRAEDHQVVIEYQDSGLGMTPDVLSRAFDPFFTTKQDKGGSGLGLAIVRQIIHEHGGEILADSRPGGGSRFVITLPVADEFPQAARLSSEIQTESVNAEDSRN
ncbi:MAG TPA: ATP-binding protein [Blastocatellia bacterium]|nr:ATP-binding protein [Blastocatellia bacterium]